MALIPASWSSLTKLLRSNTALKQQKFSETEKKYREDHLTLPI